MTQRGHHVAELAVLLGVRAGYIFRSCIVVREGYDVEYFTRARALHKSLPFILTVKNIAYQKRTQDQGC
jgi:hypothetical protein